MVKLGLYASMVSVIASVLIYIVLNDSQLAIYVGLWAPTLMALSNRYGPVLRIVNADLVEETLEKGTKV